MKGPGDLKSVAVMSCGCGISDPGRWGVLLLVALWVTGCQCVGKESNTGCDQKLISGIMKNGTFTSPDYPNPYPSSGLCTYKFEGEPNERVQVLFVGFDLYKTQEKAKDCEGEDRMMVFIDIDGRKERLDNYCGNKLPPQMMSSSPTMTMEFQTQHSSNDVSGFRAIYRFVSNYGITAGRQDVKKGCYFVFNSTERTNGTFTSPNWPGVYPRSTECHYLFFGKNTEKVHITFAYFDVDGVPPCDADTASDYVEFSNFRTVDRKIPRHCGTRKPKVVESDSDFFRVTFKSNDKFDATGFEAFFQFRNIVDPFTVKRISIPGVATSNYLPTMEIVNLFIVVLVLAFGKIQDLLPGSIYNAV